MINYYNFTDSYDYNQCIDNCIENRIESMKCTPNPFIINDFVLNDFNHKSIKVCNDSQNIVFNTKNCENDCHKTCQQIHKKLEINELFDKKRNYSQLMIRNKSFKHFIYTSEPKLKITQYFANFGRSILSQASSFGIRMLHVFSRSPSLCRMRNLCRSLRRQGGRVPSGFRTGEVFDRGTARLPALFSRR